VEDQRRSELPLLVSELARATRPSPPCNNWPVALFSMLIQRACSAPPSTTCRHWPAETQLIDLLAPGIRPHCAVSRLAVAGNLLSLPAQRIWLSPWPTLQAEIRASAEHLPGTAEANSTWPCLYQLSGREASVEAAPARGTERGPRLLPRSDHAGSGRSNTFVYRSAAWKQLAEASSPTQKKPACISSTRFGTGYVWAGLPDALAALDAGPTMCARQC